MPVVALASVSPSTKPLTAAENAGLAAPYRRDTGSTVTSKLAGSIVKLPSLTSSRYPAGDTRPPDELSIV